MSTIARTLARPRQRTRSFFFELALTSASGLLFIAAIDTAARFNLPWATDLFWFGLLLIFVPPLLAMLLLDLTRSERLTLVVLAGLALYFVKVLHSPGYFTLHDELLHWKTADTILRSGHLFTENPLLPVSPLFPGLHLATVSLAQLLGIDIYGAGVILLALMRAMFMIAIFSLLDFASGSPRVAGLATLLYMGNSNFIFFASQYAYELVALPTTILLFVVVVRRDAFTGLRRVVLNLATVILVFVVVATHHVTSYMTIALLLTSLVVLLILPPVERIGLWLERVVPRLPLYRTLICRLFPAAEASPVESRPLTQQLYGWTGLLVAITAIAWMIYVATPTLSYLSPVFSSALNELISIIQREGQTRALFTSAAGNVRPLWERLTTLGAVVLTILVFPYGVLEVWRKYRRQMVVLILTLAAAAYFASLGLRFTEKGWEISNRAGEYLFLGVALITALGGLSIFRRYRGSLWRNLLIAAGATVIFIGGFQAGWAYWARLPGPYLVSADTRSIEAEGIAAADWTAAHLAPNSRLIADRINGLLMGAFGRQYVIRSGTDNIQTAPVLVSLWLGRYEYDLMHLTRTQYVVTDRRLTQSTPELGVYVEMGEPGAMQYTQPLSELAIDKFDRLSGVSRIFDSGNIAIYDVRSLSDAPAQP